MGIFDNFKAIESGDSKQAKKHSGIFDNFKPIDTEGDNVYIDPYLNESFNEGQYKTKDENVSTISSSDWWNDLKQSWDSTQLSAYKYNKAKAQNSIDLNSKEADKLLYDINNNIGDVSSKILKLDVLQKEIDKSSSDLNKAIEGDRI